MDIKLKEANYLVRKGEYELAIPIYEECLKETPDLLFLLKNIEFCKAKIRDLQIKQDEDLDEVKRIDDAFLVQSTQIRTKGKNDKFCICLNLIENEIKDFANLVFYWHLVDRNFEKMANIDLVIALDNLSAENKGLLEAIIDAGALKQRFGSVTHHVANIPAQHNFYIRDPNHSFDSAKTPYGLKSGPNYQFFRLLDYFAQKDYRYVYFCETDCFPIKSGWAQAVFNEALENDPFYVLGSAFLGKSRVDPMIALHVNGAAIYNPRAEGFNEYQSNWEKILLELVPELPYVAYDWALDYYFYNRVRRENWGTLTHFDFYSYIDFRKKTKYADSIINLAGELETKGQLRYSLPEIYKIFPRAQVIHAKYHLDDLTWLFQQKLSDSDKVGLEKINVKLKSILSKYHNKPSTYLEGISL
jgi:hypothetical protein